MLKRAFSFVRVSGRVPSRQKLEEKLEKANIKEFLRRQNIFGKSWYYLHTHKKKNIFFACLIATAIHFDLHKSLYNWFTVVTPLQRVKRSIMKRKINPNVRFCREPLSTLEPEVHTALVKFFLKIDRELECGLIRGILVDIAREMRWVDAKDKYIGAFLWESGHREESKQRNTTMRIDQFLGFFEKMKEKTGQEEDVLLVAFLEKVPAKIHHVKAISAKRKQYEKAKEEAAKKHAYAVFERVPPPRRPEIEKLEIQSEELFAEYTVLADKVVKSLQDQMKMKELENKFIEKEALKSQRYL